MVVKRSLHEAMEEWVRMVGLAEELRVELAGDKEGMIRQFDHLCQPTFK